MGKNVLKLTNRIIQLSIFMYLITQNIITGDNYVGKYIGWFCYTLVIGDMVI